MDKTELENLIRFTKMNGMMNWSFEEVLNEYETTKMHHKEPKFDPKTLQPFDKVLVRNADCFDWNACLFSHIGHGVEAGSVICERRIWSQVIPYSEETKHLIGTSDDCPDYYKWW